MTQHSTTHQLIRSVEKTAQDAILDRLIRNGHLTYADVEFAHGVKQKERSPYGLVYHLVERGRIEIPTVLTALGDHFEYPTVDLTQVVIQKDAVKTIPAFLVRELSVLPFRVESRWLHVAVFDPDASLDTERIIREQSGYSVRTHLADEYTLRQIIQRSFSGGVDLEVSVARAANAILEDPQVHAQKEDETVENAEIPKLVDGIIDDAVRRGASDVHFEFYEDFGRVRYRIDGSLIEVTSALDPRLGPAVVNRIKVKSKLNTAQDRVPDDGTTSLQVDGHRHDLRVSTLPTVYGETAVLRILERKVRFRDLVDLELSVRDERLLRQALRKPQGMVLVTGPTGSGKSTTLYTALGMLNDGTRKILTVEEPVERRVPGITQVNVRAHTDAKQNLDYAAALKAFLRQDPDIIMVGEIRDAETATIALRASMTGHLVLSTLHTMDTAATIHRLLDLGVEPFNIATAIQLAVAQRLIRKICSQCRASYVPSKLEVQDSGFTAKELEGLDFYYGTGCERCSDTGYRGRTGIYEVMEISRPVREAITGRNSADQIRDIALNEGMTTLRQAGLAKLREGTTTLAEVSKETNF